MEYQVINMETVATILAFIKSNIAAAFIWLILLVSPSFAVMGALLVIIFADFISGIWASVINGGWSSIRSNVMSRTVGKIVLYYIAIIAGLACERLVPGIPFTNVAAGFVAVVELKSVYENVSEVTGVDIWTAIKDWIDRKSKEDNEN